MILKESLLRPEPIEESQLLFPATRETGVLSEDAQLVKEALQSLHEALIRVNVRSEDRQPYQLSVQLREDCGLNKEELAREPNLRIRENSLVFNIQRQDLENAKEGASNAFFLPNFSSSSSMASTSLSIIFVDTIPTHKPIKRWYIFGFLFVVVRLVQHVCHRSPKNKRMGHILCSKNLVLNVYVSEHKDLISFSSFTWGYLYLSLNSLQHFL